MTLKTISQTPRIGTEIKIDVETLLGGTEAAEIRRILEERGVIFFREVNLTNSQQLAFARTIGEVIPMGDEGIQKISLDKKENATADYLRGSFYWHIDGTTDDVPARASMLSARVLSPTGGQTLFANTYAAYDDLPDSEKEYLDKLKVVHTLESSQRVITPVPTYEELKRWHSYSPKSHPLVWRHRSGRKSLVLGTTASHVEGLSLEEGRELLCRLTEWTTQPQYVYRHEWKVGDLIIWDNTGTIHCVEPYAIDSGRMMHRTTLVGEEALA